MATPIFRAKIEADLRHLGLGAGDHVLVHSSLFRIGYVVGGPESVVEALLEVVGAVGTVVFPSHTGDPSYSRGNPPRFDVRHSEGRHMGRVAEAARCHRRSIRSLHPTHSVCAIGNLAPWLTLGHEQCETPCGPGSPYHRLSLRHGKILLLGCGHEANTTLHMMEEILQLPYHLLPGKAPSIVTDLNGRSRRIECRLHRWGVPRDFMRIDAELTRKGIQQVGTVGNAEGRLIDTESLSRLLLSRLRHDPYFFLPAGYVLPGRLDFQYSGFHQALHRLRWRLRTLSARLGVRC